ncbi:LuxR C-terminal-related transcriptional regulator [Candidatus Latescibacterota bacterium]
MKEINLLIIEDNRLLREGIKAVIQKQPGFNVETAPGNGENILRIIGTQKTDVLLIDLGLPKHDNLEFMINLKAVYPEIKIIIMGLNPIQEEILQFIEAGVSGFILKDATIEDFLDTIRSVADGEKVLPSNMTKSLFSIIINHGIKTYGESKLVQSVRMTNREREVVALIADGMTNKEIAQKLHLSPYTVKSHVHNILEKMALNTRVQIAIYARSNEDIVKPENAPSQSDK